MGNPRIADAGKKTRFKPGVSGNKKGRPKGSPNLSTIVKEVLADEDLARKLLANKKELWEALPTKNLATAAVIAMALKTIDGNIAAATWLLKAYGPEQPEEVEEVEIPMYVLDMSPAGE